MQIEDAVVAAQQSRCRQRSAGGMNPHDPTPVADAVCFLLSDLARGITGAITHVDGGHHAMA